MTLNLYNTVSANTYAKNNTSMSKDNLNQRIWQKKEWDMYLNGFVENYSDEKFAAHLQSENTKEIMMEKNINWQSAGEHTLTGDQIDYLKSTYDIENMSDQDYYNLIADLTNMNAISGKDAARQHAGVLPIGVVLDVDSGGRECVGSIGDFSMYSGNVYHNILNRYQQYSETLDKIRQSAPYGDAGQYLDFKSYLEEEQQTYGRMVDIFDKILR